jgi:hypothetical protein
MKKTAIIEEFWSRGYLSYKLREHQLAIYDAYWEAINSETTIKFVGNISRRFGKSFIALLVAFEYALRFPKSKIKIACATQGQMGKIVEEVGTPILSDCPLGLKPTYRNGRFTFKNGSFIQLAGSDLGNSDRLRGTSTHLALIDEAGFVGDLKYLISSVLMPTMLTVKGTMIVYSTPAKSKDHYFTQLFHEAKADGCAFLRTISDDPTVTPEIREIYAKEYGGEQSTEFRREFLCEFITDEDIAVVPEWDSEKFVLNPVPDCYYEYYHKYVSLDIGVKDNTAALFGYYNFRTRQVVIEEEITMSGPTMTTDKLAAAIDEVEDKLWKYCKPPHHANPDKVYRRVGDTNNLLLLQDLSKLHGINFVPTGKNRLIQMVNNLRMWVKSGRLIVQPQCLQTIGCLEAAYWDAKHTSFAHSKLYAHFDHLAALVYFILNVDERRNPIPEEQLFDNAEMYVPAGSGVRSTEQLRLANAVLGRRTGVERG